MRFRTAALLAALALPLTLAAAQPKTASPVRPDSAPALSEKDTAALQRQLIDLLKLSPRLTTVVAHDPSLLADTDYVTRNNPQLAAFLAAHPDIARNPEFYLFSHMNPGDNGPDEALERAVWPEIYRNPGRRTGFDEFLSDAPPLLAFACFLAAVIWGIRVLIENRRWSRTFKLQSEVHGRLIDKFSSSQELAAYMQTEAGKRFLEAAPIPLHSDTPQSIPNAVARILTPIQIGVVMVLLGIGCILLRHTDVNNEVRMLVWGTVILMPGIGFILSAGITWILASRLGLMPPPQSAPQSNSDRS
jgi:hypothetical protein